MYRESAPVKDLELGNEKLERGERVRLPRRSFKVAFVAFSL